MATSKICKEISIIRAIQKHYPDDECFNVATITSLLINIGYPAINSGRISDAKDESKYKECLPISKKELDKLIKIHMKEKTVPEKESINVEFKEKFLGYNNGVLLKTIYGMANNNGGEIFLGIKDNGEIVGLNEEELQKANIDLDKINKAINKYCSNNIKVEFQQKSYGEKIIAIINVNEVSKINKPIMTKKPLEKMLDKTIYYRYPASTSPIEKEDLDHIYNEKNISMISGILETIGKNGFENIAMLNLKEGKLIGKENVYRLNKEIAKEFKYIHEYESSEKKGALALKIMGNIVVSESYTKTHPLIRKDFVKNVVDILKKKQVAFINKKGKEIKIEPFINFLLHEFGIWNDKERHIVEKTGKLTSHHFSKKACSDFFDYIFKKYNEMGNDSFVIFLQNSRKKQR